MIKEAETIVCSVNGKRAVIICTQKGTVILCKGCTKPLFELLADAEPIAYGAGTKGMNHGLFCLECWTENKWKNNADSVPTAPNNLS